MRAHDRSLASALSSRLHWTRIGLLAGAILVVASTFLPWLVGVPPNLLDIGSGTIICITTIHGIIACVAMLGIALLALRPLVRDLDMEPRPSSGVQRAT